MALILKKALSANENIGFQLIPNSGYLNEQRGHQIRKSITQQLIQFLKNNSQEIELHIITHSLGSVILWDILFSERFKSGDPAFNLRSLIKNLNNKSLQGQVYLKSIITMGSPNTSTDTLV